MTFEEMCGRMSSLEFTLWRAKALLDMHDANHARQHARNVSQMR